MGDVAEEVQRKRPEQTAWLLPCLARGQAWDCPLWEDLRELSVSRAPGKQPPVAPSRLNSL